MLETMPFFQAIDGHISPMYLESDMLWMSNERSAIYHIDTLVVVLQALRSRSPKSEPFEVALVINH